MTDVKRFRKPEQAQRYVAGVVAATLKNDIDNGAGWLSIADDEDEDGDPVGNLADSTTAALVIQAATQLENQLRDYSNERIVGKPPTQSEWAKAAWELYAHIHSRGEGPTFHLFLKTLMPLINRSGVKEPK